MKLLEISQLDNIQNDNEQRVVALGFFDGVHIAHQEIIKKTVEHAKKHSLLSTLITFDKSPKEYFAKEKIKLITPKEDKINIIKKLGIDELIILEFNDKLRNITKEEFIDKVLLKINTTEVYCGYDYAFGYKGEGNSTFISEHTQNQINVNVIPQVKKDNIKISSTNLREKILEGNFEEYFEFTHRFYELRGTVVKGRQLGRTINFPTANLQVEHDYLLPEKLGVYITLVKVRDVYYKGITNIGNNPTVSTENKLFIETHILDFDMDIYDEQIELYFVTFIRPEMKFANIDELKEQLTKDKELAEQFKIKFEKFYLSQEFLPEPIKNS